MQVMSRQGSSSADTRPSLSERTSGDASLVCRHVQQLHDAERHLIDALAIVRESITRCEQALARLADAREGATHTVGPAGIFALAGAGVSLMQADPSDGSVDGASPAAAVRRCLTARELEILRRIAEGKSNKQIAGELFLSARTVERHIANIYLKINVHNKAEATAYALRRQLV